MPELPEVETIKQDLNSSVKGEIFESVEILDSKVVRFSKKEFTEKLKNRRVDQSQRFGKILVITTNSDHGLLIHLKMTGQLIYQTERGERSGGGHPDKLYYGKKLPHQYTRLIFRFKDGSKLFFNDLRKFGWVKIVKTKDLDSLAAIKQLGVEPLSREFTISYLKQGLERRKRSNIKTLLMDQSFIAGIGNIYSAESLFKAKIDPRRKASSLKEAEIKKLYQAIKDILKIAIKLRGTTQDSYLDLKGKKGGYLPQAYVYGREGERCRKCSSKIEKIKINNRGTYFCPKCQR